MPDIGKIESSKLCSSVEKKDSNLRRLLLEDTLDVAPAGLTFCFDRESFLNNDFNSDDFILEHYCRGISLEKLRDDLLQYSNILKSSLIELINQDYADFVSLSTNLVGLDKSIDTITTPLKQLQSYVSSVLEELQSTDQELSTKLKSLQHIKNEKDYANSLFTLGACVSRLERWLTQSNERLVNEEQMVDQFYYKSNNNNNNNGETSKDINNDIDDDNEVDIWPVEFYADCSLHEDIGQRMDRIANEYIKLQFFAKKCRGHTILNSLKPRIHWITVNLQEQLDARLKESFEACCLLTVDKINDCPAIAVSRSSIEQLRQVISIYLAIDKLSDLMLIYRKFVLHDKLSQIFTPRLELTHAGSDTTVASETLDSMYTRALKILDSQLYHVKEHILRSSPENSESLSDFDCLVSGFWPETIDLICDNLPEVFSPGHPDRFYSLYTVSMRFVEAVEKRTWSNKQLTALRNHPSYSIFVNKWSLPVYFQIRFQEIASSVESAMKKGLMEIKDSQKSCLTEVTEVVICQLNRCWEKGIYLDKLMHRFWKLTLQILSRYSSFIEEQLKSIQENNIISQSSSDPTKPNDHNFPELQIFFLVDCFRLVDFVRLELKENLFTCLHQRLTQTATASNQSVNYERVLTDCLEQSCKRLITSINPIIDLVVNRIQVSVFSYNITRMPKPKSVMKFEPAT
ncbi:hypothetical protein MN116_007126 [Schistosoma mekongi]|uniref:Conserved oligomeric Golgi complex subunit 2 n=1 Tax=Schistosoma mekongi TaxID=38744 RepID=A0AAE1Z9Y8_SCHME|nr:hypothetical protein MN116_007126 [Schistosoma mekongi]